MDALSTLKPPEYSPQSFRRYASAILFCDVRGFTHLFDQKNPDEAFLFMASVYERIAVIVENNGGRICNLTGDGFLAQFSHENFADKSLSLQESAEYRAVKCSLGIRQELEKINKERHMGHDFTFSLGIGINSGMIADGTINLLGKTMSLIVGDIVNTASRIESLCKFFSVDILISDEVEKIVRGRFPLLAMPSKELRGKKGKFNTYWIMPVSS